MAVDTTKTNVLDYTVDIAALVTAIDALTTKLDTVNTTLLDTNIKLDSLSTTMIANGTALTTSLSDNITTNLNKTLADLSVDFTTVKDHLIDPTLGIHTKQVDLPYQGIYQRALSRQALSDGGVLDKLARVIQEEKQAPIFASA